MEHDSADARATAAKRYDAYSSKTSEIVRSLSLAAIALAWLFSGGLTVGGQSQPQDILNALKDTSTLYTAAVASIIALAFDLWQYALGAIRWGLLRWSFVQVRMNDRSEALTNRARFSWAVLRWFKYVARYTKRHPTFAEQSSNWSAIRAELRRNLRDLANQTPPDDSALIELLNWQPASVSRPTTMCWLVKIAGCSVAYVSLALYLL